MSDINRGQIIIISSLITPFRMESCQIILLLGHAGRIKQDPNRPGLSTAGARLRFYTVIASLQRKYPYIRKIVNQLA